MTFIRFLLPFFIVFGTNAQQRIGVDVNTRLHTINVTAQYHRVIKGPWLLTAGVGGGYYGYGENFASESEFANGDFHNGYVTLPETHSSENPTYKLRGTDVFGTGVKGFVGIGFFKEFKKFHGFRINLNHYFLWARSNTLGFYKDFDLQEGAGIYRYIWHPLGAISPEFYHTIRINSRYTFYWGGKFPYYYSLDKARFDPKVKTELFYKFLPDITFGFTRAIGKCD